MVEPEAKNMGAAQGRTGDNEDTHTPESLVDLAARLARNMYDVYRHRLDSEAETSTHKVEDLQIPLKFDDLTQTERERAIAGATEALKGIMSLEEFPPLANGRSTATPTAQPLSQDDDIEAVLDHFRDPSASLASLLTVWRARKLERWSRTPMVYRALGRKILELGEPLLAYDVLAEGLGYWPTDVRMRQLHALALSRSGATHRANQILLQLKNEGNCDEETLGLLARTHKDLWMQADSPEQKSHEMRMALDTYLTSYDCSGGYYAGINAATMAMLAGEREQARTIAHEVREICLQELERPMDRDARYWPVATLAETALIMNELDLAGEWYAEAAELGRGQYGKLNSTRRNAWLILDHLGVDRSEIGHYFNIPKVVVFAGHMIDRPDRPEPRFPSELEERVRRAIRDRLMKLNAFLGYSSAACGSDIIFLETLLDLRGEAHIVLPYNKRHFIAESVEIVPGLGWGERFETVLERATEVLTASEQKMQGGSMSYEYTNLLIHGLASMRAEQLETDLVALAVWDGKIGDGLGGTASIVDHWQHADRQIEVIDTEEMLRDDGRIELSTATAPRSDQQVETMEPPAENDSGFTAEIIAILFADAVNFSKLSEEELPRFVHHFLGEIGEIARTSAHAPAMKNTWGDGLYLVFNSVRDAGLFALELYDRICCTNWGAYGLPDTLNLRIALHAGPVYSCIDPVTGNPNYIGTHINHAARIEPITPPGEVYASQAFAALAAAQRVSEFTCDYVGQTPLAKEHGTFPTYLLRRRK